MAQWSRIGIIAGSLALSTAATAFAQIPENARPADAGAAGPMTAPPSPPPADTGAGGASPIPDQPPAAAPPPGPGGSSANKSTPEQREERWKTHHIDLDLLPVAYVEARRRLPIGSSLRMVPIGYPASSYSLYPNLQFRVTPRTVLALGASGADPLGHSGTAIFYGVGLQHLLLPETRHLPALAIGGYGFLAPQNRHGRAGYLVASRQLTPHAYPRGAFLHLGLLLQSFGDGTSGTDARPFLGANYVWSRRLRFTGEYRPAMSWEANDPYTVRAVFLFTRRFGVSGGYRQNGYRAHPFIGIEID